MKRTNETREMYRQIRPTFFFSISLLKSEMIHVIIPIGYKRKLRIYNVIFSNEFINNPPFVEGYITMKIKGKWV